MFTHATQELCYVCRKRRLQAPTTFPLGIRILPAAVGFLKIHPLSIVASFVNSAVHAGFLGGGFFGARIFRETEADWSCFIQKPMSPGHVTCSNLFRLPGPHKGFTSICETFSGKQRDCELPLKESIKRWSQAPDSHRSHKYQKLLKDHMDQMWLKI